ncbi:class I SAM-dependent methyltransferase [Streptomyces sp. NBC_00455]|uniref:class I SAM-dependent methyltransferase n=1 Tax=Streptomyces sp. NBC_00455 TaxID=2903654 RepID=UPI002E1A616F
MRPVSHTAQWTAAARALESERTDALFQDPHARPLAGRHGFDLLEQHPAGGLVDFVAIRTHYLDRAIEAACRDGEVRQVALVACGLDTRAFRLPWPRDAVVYELDHGDLLDAKQERLDELSAEPAVRRVPVAVDLAQDWEPALLDAGFDPRAPVLWVPEALLFFLERPEVERLLRRFRAVSAPGSVLAVDILGEWALRNPAAQGFFREMRESGTAWRFGTDDPEGLLEDSGWKPVEVLQPGEPGGGEQRWPYQVQPRAKPYVPRNFLVTASC